MAKSRVKGIVVSIGGDTKGLDKALSGTNKQIQDTQSRLKDVERLLKLDPKNTELLAQKQKLLAQAVAETEGKLRTLNEANKEVKERAKNWDAYAAAVAPIKQEIQSTTEALEKLLKKQERLEKQGKVDTDTYKALTQDIEETQAVLDQLKESAANCRAEFGKPIPPEQYDALQREIIETEQELKGLKTQAKNTLDAMDIEAREAAEKMEQLGKAAKGVKEKADNVAGAMKPITLGVAGLVTAATATVPATEDLREGLSRLDQNALDNRVSIDAARAAWKEFAVQNGDTGAAIEATSNLLQAGFTESNLQKAVENLAGAANRFPDTLKVESLADSLQETLATGAATGQFTELLDRLGLSTEEFNTAMTACTTEAQKQNLALQTLTNAGLAGSYNQWKLNNEEMVRSKEASLESQLAMAELAETVLPFVTMATEALTKFLEGFNALPDGAKGAIATLLLLVGAVGPVASAVSGAAGAIEHLSKINLPGLSNALGKITGVALPGLQTAFSSVFGFIAANPVVLLIGAIVGLVALVVGKGEEIIDCLNKVDDFLQNVFATDWTEVFGPVLGGGLNNFFDLVEGVWNGIKSILEGVINFIQGVFTGNWEQAWLGVRQIFAGIFEGLEALLKAPINGVIQMVNAAIGGINWLIDGVNRIPGVNLSTIGKIPLLANGGEVIRGSAIVGEAGAELLTVMPDRTVVQPLNQTTNHRTTQMGGVNMHIYGAPGQDVRELAEIVMEEMQGFVDREEAAIGC